MPVPAGPAPDPSSGSAEGNRRRVHVRESILGAHFPLAFGGLAGLNTLHQVQCTLESGRQSSRKRRVSIG